MSNENLSETDIAVVGMSCHFPGASDVEQYWRNLRDGVESVRTLTDEELEAAGVDAATREDPAYVKVAAYPEGVEDFDPGFFGISAKDAAIMDPQHRHFLECCWEAMENAGHVPSRFDGAIGVFAGSGMTTYFMHNLLTNPDLMAKVGFFLLRHTGNDKDFLSTFVSYKMNLTGPSVNVQTACSTSLVAIHQAAQSLLAGECDMAIAGGCTIMVPHKRGYRYEAGEILAQDGHCRTFDASATGTIFGHGGGAVILRRAEDAVADGDYIHAIIKGSAINNDGSGKAGYLAPSVEGQAKAIAEALAVAGVEAGEIDYVESHGTGTAVGDPIEVAALTQAFRETTKEKGYCGLGSVKPNIGHLDTGAGVASFIKVAASLDHEALPPSLFFERPNPELAIERTPFYVNAELKPWKRGSRPRLAGVSSLGVGGTNAHVVMSEAPVRDASDEGREYALFVLSGRTPSSVDAAAARLADHLEAHPEAPLEDVAYTLQVGRSAFECRRALAASTREEAITHLRERTPQRVFDQEAKPGEAPVVFMLPGGGAQYPNMGADLYRTEPVFREHVDRGLEVLRKHLDFDLKGLWFCDPADREQNAETFARPAIQLPAIFIIEYALAQLWMSWGVQPSALLGHSLGENTAACLAGVMSFEDCLGLVALRGRLFEQVDKGGMVSVEASVSDLEPLLDEGLTIAVINGPELTVVSGRDADLDRLSKRLSEKEIEHRRVKIDIAAHSPLLESILEPFGAYLRSITLSKPQIPFCSNVSGTWIRDEEATDPDYWVRHLRSTVRFADNVATLLEDPNRVLLEVGPGRTLSSLSRQHPDTPKGHPVFSSLRHPDEAVSDVAYLLTVYGRVWGAGAAVDWAQFHGERRRLRVPLPAYPFERQRYWIDPGKPNYAAETAAPLTRAETLDDWFYRPKWKPVALEPQEETGPQRYLVFMDTAGVGADLVSRLEEAGNEVYRVVEGDTYFRRGDREFVVAPEGGREGYDQLVAALVEAEALPDRIVHLWLLPGDAEPRPGSSLFHHFQERGFYSLLYLFQALGDEGVGDDPLHLVTVTSGMQRASDDDEVAHPNKATVLGPVKVLPREFPGITSTVLDVELPKAAKRRFLFGGKDDGGLERLQETVATVVQATSEDKVLAAREGNLLEQAYTKAVPAVREEGPRLRDGAVVLITGGMGSIGLGVAEHFAAQAKTKLVLMGRSKFPAREAWDQWLENHGESDGTSRKIRRLRDIEATGSEVMVVAADVADITRMQKVVEEVGERFGPVTGIVHAAGTMDDGIIQLKTQASVEDVFSPKVQGTLVLAEVLAEAPLEFFVLFSSTSAVIAPAGQVDYTAANCFLDAFAHARATDPNCQTVAIEWGVWKDVGLAADLRRRLFGEEVQDDRPHELASHPLLTERVLVSDDETHFVSRLSAADCWVLDEHRTGDRTPVFPGTGYIELLRAAYRELHPEGALEIRDLTFLSPLVVPEGSGREVRVQLTRAKKGYEFEVSSRDPDDITASTWQVHAEGRVRSESGEAGTIDVAATRDRCQTDVRDDGGSVLRTSQQEHLEFGPRWQVLRRVGNGDGEAFARLALEGDLAQDVGTFAAHPGLLDLATSFTFPGLPTGEDIFYVPLSYESVRLHAPVPAEIWSHLRPSARNRGDGEVVMFDVSICDAQGNVVMEVNGYTMRRVQGSATLSVADRPAAVATDAANLSPAEELFVRTVENGITLAEGMEALDRVLGAERMAEIVANPVDLHRVAELTHEASGEREAAATFARPNLRSEYAPPNDELEETLASFWQEFLGVDKIGIHDDFFELGGHSLVAVRLFAKIQKTYGVEFPLSLLFEAPTIAKCADILRRELGDTPATGGEEGQRSSGGSKLVVPMNNVSNDRKLPFFIVSGMFGNVLNLRHLAAHLGADQPVYALQARGLYGDEEPHNRFEDMASEFIEEIKKIQPEGPYLLGGFSGGGITALEMSHQLSKVGEQAGLCVMLDTPAPHPPQLSDADKVKIHMQRLKEQGPAYVTSWAKRRWAWEKGKFKQRMSGEEAPAPTPAEFRSEKIREAFVEAVDAYQPPPYEGRITLFRPALDCRYTLGPGRIANSDRVIVDEHNHWKPYLRGIIDVHTVGGDHDSMVLEPHVRGLAAAMRACIEDAQRKADERAA